MRPVHTNGVDNPHGPPTIAGGWKISVRKSNGVILAGQTVGLATGNPAFTLRQGGSPVLLKNSDRFPRVAALNPIVAGEERSGWIEAVFRNIDRQMLVEDRATIVVSFQDIFGHRYTMEKQLTGSPLTGDIDPGLITPQ
jgi:hypothetical protein